MTRFLVGCLLLALAGPKTSDGSMCRGRDDGVDWIGYSYLQMEGVQP